jgi:hypothetical protein
MKKDFFNDVNNVTSETAGELIMAEVMRVAFEKSIEGTMDDLKKLLKEIRTLNNAREVRRRMNYAERVRVLNNNGKGEEAFRVMSVITNEIDELEMRAKVKFKELFSPDNLLSIGKEDFSKIKRKMYGTKDKIIKGIETLRIKPDTFVPIRSQTELDSFGSVKYGDIGNKFYKVSSSDYSIYKQDGLYVAVKLFGETENFDSATSGKLCFGTPAKDKDGNRIRNENDEPLWKMKIFNRWQKPTTRRNVCWDTDKLYYYLKMIETEEITLELTEAEKKKGKTTTRTITVRKNYKDYIRLVLRDKNGNIRMNYFIDSYGVVYNEDYPERPVKSSGHFYYVGEYVINGPELRIDCNENHITKIKDLKSGNSDFKFEFKYPDKSFWYSLEAGSTYDRQTMMLVYLEPTPLNAIEDKWMNIKQDIDEKIRIGKLDGRNINHLTEREFPSSKTLFKLVIRHHSPIKILSEELKESWKKNDRLKITRHHYTKISYDQLSLFNKKFLYVMDVNLHCVIDTYRKSKKTYPTYKSGLVVLTKSNVMKDVLRYKNKNRETYNYYNKHEEKKLNEMFRLYDTERNEYCKIVHLKDMYVDNISYHLNLKHKISLSAGQKESTKLKRLSKRSTIDDKDLPTSYRISKSFDYYFEVKGLRSVLNPNRSIWTKNEIGVGAWKHVDPNVGRVDKFHTVEFIAYFKIIDVINGNMIPYKIYSR